MLLVLSAVLVLAALGGWAAYVLWDRQQRLRDDADTLEKDLQNETTERRGSVIAVADQASALIRDLHDDYKGRLETADTERATVGARVDDIASGLDSTFAVRADDGRKALAEVGTELSAKDLAILRHVVLEAGTTVTGEETAKLKLCPGSAGSLSCSTVAAEADASERRLLLQSNRVRVGEAGRYADLSVDDRGLALGDVDRPVLVAKGALALPDLDDSQAGAAPAGSLFMKGGVPHYKDSLGNVRSLVPPTPDPVASTA